MMLISASLFCILGRRLAVKTIKKTKNPLHYYRWGNRPRQRSVCPFYHHLWLSPCSMSFKRAENKCPAHSRHSPNNCVGRTPAKHYRQGVGRTQTQACDFWLRVGFTSAVFTPFSDEAEHAFSGTEYSGTAERPSFCTRKPLTADTHAHSGTNLKCVLA